MRWTAIVFDRFSVVCLDCFIRKAEYIICGAGYFIIIVFGPLLTKLTAHLNRRTCSHDVGSLSSTISGCGCVRLGRGLMGLEASEGVTSDDSLSSPSEEPDDESEDDRSSSSESEPDPESRCDDLFRSSRTPKPRFWRSSA